MKITYDPNAKALYIRLQAGLPDGEHIDFTEETKYPDILIDIKNERVYGIEILNVEEPFEAKIYPKEA